LGRSPLTKSISPTKRPTSRCPSRRREMAHPPRFVGSRLMEIVQYMSMATCKTKAPIGRACALGAGADSTAIDPVLRTLDHRLNRDGERATRQPYPHDRMPPHAFLSRGGPE
jgi:hypothetical protein